MKVAVITGGSSGIGLSAARLFSARGYRVYELSRRAVETPGVTHLACDVTDPAAVRSAVDAVREKEGRIDLLINNAGMGISGPAELADPNEVRRLFEVNFFGALYATQAVIPLMRDQKDGCILFVSSVASPVSIPFQAFYSASKSALQTFSNALRCELKPFGIRVASILPGDTNTGFTDARRKDARGSDFYGDRAERAVAAMEKDERRGMSPEAVSLVLWRAAKALNPRVFYTVGFSYKILVFLTRILPSRLVYAVVGMLYS